MSGLVVYNSHLAGLVAVHTVHKTLEAETVNGSGNAALKAQDAETIGPGIRQKLQVVLQRLLHIPQQDVLQHQVAAGDLEGIHLVQNLGPDEAAKAGRIGQKAGNIGLGDH